MKEEFNKDMENLRNLGYKNFLKSNKKYRGNPLQQATTSERQNLRT
jgi:hypothetical protein